MIVNFKSSFSRQQINLLLLLSLEHFDNVYDWLEGTIHSEILKKSSKKWKMSDVGFDTTSSGDIRVYNIVKNRIYGLFWFRFGEYNGIRICGTTIGEIALAKYQTTDYCYNQINLDKLSNKIMLKVKDGTL